MESVIPVCRICLNASTNYIDFQSRFESTNLPSESTRNYINYLQCLRLCTNLPIEEDDGGPQCLCAGCESELQVVYSFLQKAQDSHAILEESWQKNDPNEATIEHTEISIETQNVANFDKEEFLSECDKISKDSDDLIDYLEEDESLVLSEENYIPGIEETITKEGEQSESLHRIEYLPEDVKNLKNNMHMFIVKKYKCHICNRSYTTERLLKVHLNYHKRRNVRSKPYSCKICGEQFSLQRYLTQHMIEHQDCREIHKCQYCEKEYVTKTALISHKRIHQGEALKCTECGKQFNGSYEFSVHLRFHKREKEHGVYKCEICNKEYSSPRYLSQHKPVHLSERKAHKCIYCNKEYVSKTALNNHKRLQEGQTTKCSECGKQFTRNCELKIHMRFHKHEYPFKCTLCEKEFTIKSHLRMHMWNHQGIKLECKECGKLFGSTKALKEHSYKHSEMPYPCEFCEKAYPSEQKYKIHLQKMHCSDKNGANLIHIERTTYLNSS